MKLSFETMYEIWDDEHGTHIEVGPDRDALDMVEIRRYDDSKSEKCSQRMTFARQEAEMIADAIRRILGQ